MASNIDTKIVGQALQEVPVHTMIKDMALGIAAAQKELDQNAFNQLRLVADQKVVVPTQNGVEEVSLISLGLVPSFYHFSEFNMSANVSIRYEATEEKAFGLDAGFKLNYSNGDAINQAWRERREESRRTQQGEAASYKYSGYISSYDSTADKFIFISNQVAIAENQDKTGFIAYLSQEQVKNYNYKHEGLLWRPRLFTINGAGKKEYLAILNLDDDGKVSGVSSQTLNGVAVYAVSSMTGTGLPANTINMLSRVRFPALNNGSEIYIEDPQQATTPIPVSYSVQVYSYEDGTTFPASHTEAGKSQAEFLDERHFGMIYFGYQDNSGRSLADLQEFFTGHIDQPGSSDPAATGGILDIGRGYKINSSSGSVELQAPSPTNVTQYRRFIGGTDGRNDALLLQEMSTRHKVVCFCRANKYGELDIYAGKYSDAAHNASDSPVRNYIGHGCFYDARDIHADDFFANIPDTVKVKPMEIPVKQGLSEELYLGRFGLDDRTVNEFQDTSGDSASSDKRFALGVAANISVHDARKYEFDMSATTKIDAKVVAVSAPMKLLEAFNQPEPTKN